LAGKLPSAAEWKIRTED